MRKEVLAKRYAKALCLVLEVSEMDGIREELLSFASLVNESHELQNTLNNETLKLATRTELLDKVLSLLSPHPVLYRFLHILMRHARLPVLSEIANYYDMEADSRLGRLRGELIAPVVVSDEDMRAMQDRLSEEFGKKVILTQRPNGNLLGGFMVRIGDWLFDATLETELLQLQARLAGLHNPGDSGRQESSNRCD
ncbi:MAG: F0F1 ATP synthase subunit delta [Candidatus Coatesbacteria bacterium]|nr:F0F1 ATP synthase subunit delta [Candidatus Coatesbacteria bacterium]